MKLSRLWTGTAAGAAAALALTGCAAVGTTTDTTSSASAGGAPAAVAGFDPAAGTITVGDVLALSGPIAATAKEQLIGQQTWYDEVNAKGGVAGKYKIELETADNKYNAQLAVQAYQELQPKVTMLSGVLGTDSVNALVPILDQNDGVAVPSAQDAAFKTQPGLVPIFASYQTNVVNAVSYLHSKAPAEQPVYCAMVLDSPWGEADSEGLAHITEALGSSVTTTVKFAALDTAFTAQVQELKNSGCTVVVFGGAANNLPSVVAAATQLDYAPQWVAEFIANSTAFKTSAIADYLTQHVIFTGPGTKLDDESVPGIKALRAALGSTELTVQHVYGYMQAVATTHLLEKAVENGDLSGAGLRQAMTQVGTIDFEGLSAPVTLGAPDQRELPKATTIYAYDVSAPSGLSAVAVQYEAPEGVPADF